MNRQKLDSDQPEVILNTDNLKVFALSFGVTEDEMREIERQRQERQAERSQTAA